MAKPMDIQS
jgi:hypothetical protein